MDLSLAFSLCRKIESLTPDAEALVVGGAVRDYVMGVPCDDIDISHNLPIKTVNDHFNSGGIGQGESFGITVITHEGERFEAACFRKDGEYLDGRRPSSVSVASDFREDSARRDFTINAMGMNCRGGIEDHWGGVADIKARQIRCVGNPDDRLKEDPARMFRAIRFAATLGFNIEPETFNAIKANACSSYRVANERITKELLKSATTGEKLATFIELADQTELLSYFLPEIARTKDFHHNPTHHPEGGVFDHTMAALRASEETDPARNLSILFHDVGKPDTFTVGKTGNPTYYGHEQVGAQMIPSIGKRLRLPNDVISLCSSVAEHHGRMHSIAEMRFQTKVGLWLEPHFGAIMAASMADDRCRLHCHDEAKMQAKFTAFVQEMVSTFGSPKQLKNNLERMLSGTGKTLIEDAPLVNGTKAVGIIRDQTRDWMIANKLNVTPEQTRRQMFSLYRNYTAADDAELPAKLDKRDINNPVIPTPPVK